ncbi:MAG: 30S ribosomal protein S4 [Clostridia bacterium]
MARYTDSVCRLCRREGQKLFLKGDRCYSGKCSQTKRPTPPGQHGQARARKQSEYGIQLREKQKCRRAYGVLESQFRKYYEMASNMRGVTGENMLCLLERRLDNVVYRLGLGNSRAEARQMVNHGHIRIDGNKVDIASFLVKPGQVITVRERSRDINIFKELKEQGVKNTPPKWLEMDAENLTGKVITMPKREDVDLSIAEHLIVEFYSR